MSEVLAAAAQEKVIHVTARKSGYGTSTITGTYSGPVTEADLRERFFDPFFGGRAIRMANGQFSLIVHTD